MSTVRLQFGVVVVIMAHLCSGFMLFFPLTSPLLPLHFIFTEIISIVHYPSENEVLLLHHLDSINCR